MKCRKNCKSWFLGIGTLVALLSGVLISIDPTKYTALVMGVTRFFDVMLPILAVLALLKFIWCCAPQQPKDK